MPWVSPVLRITSIWCGPRHDESVQCLGKRRQDTISDGCTMTFVCFFVGILKRDEKGYVSFRIIVTLVT